MKTPGLSRMAAVAAIVILIGAMGCGGGDGNGVKPTILSKLALSLFNMEPAAAGWIYEVWVSNNSQTTSLGKFQVTGFNGDGSAIIADENGVEYTGGVVASNNLDLTTFTSIMVTIESPAEQQNTTPSPSVVLYVDLDTNQSILRMEMPSVYGDDIPFADSLVGAFGTYVITTPTNDGGYVRPDRTDSMSGIWCIYLSGNPSLDIPDAPDGWRYALWIEKDGIRYDLGRFINGREPDSKATYYSNTSVAPPYPGEDFFENPPAGVTFPLVFVGGEVVSVVLMPEGYPEEFYEIKILADHVSMVVESTEYPMRDQFDIDIPLANVELAE